MSAAEVPEQDAGGVALPEPARQQVIQLAADLLGRLKPAEIPASLRAIAKFTPAARRQRGSVLIAAALDTDDAFRERVAETVAETLPSLVAAISAGDRTAASEPADVAAVAYLVRPQGWESVVAEAGARWAAGRSHEEEFGQERARLLAEIAELRSRAKADAARMKEAVAAAGAEAAAELAELKRSLRIRTGDMRAAERARDAAQAALADAEARAEKAEAAREADSRRFRARITELERAGESVRRDARSDRDVDDARLWLLLETLKEATAGVRRELSLPPPSIRPADAVMPANEPETGRTARDAAALDRLLALPQVHLIVDGYNVTKTGYDELPLVEQRERLIGALAALAARRGAEVTVAFDGKTRPTVQPRVPRGIRVQFSVGEIADDLIRRLVAAEPPGRPVVVVTSDLEIVADVQRAGAWTAPSAVLLALLG